MEHEHMEHESRFSYFFLGVGIGVAIGIVFAPKSGRDTRTLLKTKADESKEYLAKTGEQIRESATGLYERGKNVVSKQRDQVSAAVEAGKQAYHEAIRSSQTGTQAPPAPDAGKL